ncbi:MAG: DNA polymerase I [Phycisphaerae bacterium]
MSEKLFLIDGHSQIYRAYFAPFRDLTSPIGEPTRATYVFCSMLLKLIVEKRPKYLAMAIDGPATKLHRRKLYPEYKVTRKPMPDDLPPQVERIIQIVKAMGIPVLEAEGYEADDVLATAASRFGTEEMDVVMVSRDKDLDQLVNENVVLYDPMKDEVLDAATIQDRKGYTPEQAVEIQTLTGDSTDNIPGIPGVGPKKALSLIQKYGSAEAVVEHADELTPKLKQNVKEFTGQLPVTRELVTLQKDVPLELELEDLRFRREDLSPAREIFRELGLNRLLDQLDKLDVPTGEGNADIPPLEDASTTGGTVAQTTTADDFEYETIDTPEKLAGLVDRLRSVRRLAVDTETTSQRPMWAKLVGISLAWEPGKAVYVPVRGPLGARTLDEDDVRAALGPILADPEVEKIGQHIKYDLIVLQRAGFEVRGKLFDTMIAAHVLDSSRLTYKLDALAMEYLGHHCIPIEEVIGRGKKQTTMDAVPVEIVSPYAAEDADVTLRLADVLAGKLRTEKGLTELMDNLEIPLLPVLRDMEMRGIRLDPQRLKAMEVELDKQADGLRERILEMAEVQFNVDSPKQLGEVLFVKIGLPVIKKTKTGPSTDSGVLEELAAQHCLPALVLDYRKLTKLLSTYLRALAECIHPQTGRVHTCLHQTGTATGRLSSSDPNLQNIPVRTEEGRKVRSAFVAAEGCRLLSADYSQVELRVLAHLCEDETLMAAFRADQDIHATVAAEVFGVPLEEVTPDQRARAKTVNFGIVYGQTAFGLARTLRISRGEAGEFIEKYRARFPKIDAFLQACIEQAKTNGYVVTLFGRRRKITDIDARNPQRRAAAERLAINSVVQGSAADLIKQAMINLDDRIRREQRPGRMLLQIHDELLFEIPSGEVEAEKTMIVEEMAGAIELSVPLKVDVGVGDDWMSAK